MYCHFSVSSCQSFHCPTLWQRALVFHYKLNLTTLSFVVYNRSGENSLYLTDRELPPPKQLCTRMFCCCWLCSCCWFCCCWLCRCRRWFCCCWRWFCCCRRCWLDRCRRWICSCHRCPWTCGDCACCCCIG
jgi:hypothetical protein